METILDTEKKVLDEYNRIVGINGPQARFVDTGGGNYAIEAPLGNGYLLYWGGLGEGDVWAYDLMAPDGDVVRSDVTTLRFDYPDATRVACVLYDTLCAFIDGELE